jgi:uncharacterized protein (DUF2141 family)
MQTRRIANLKLAAAALNFISENKIETLADMTAAVRKLRDKYNEIKGKVYPMSRRSNTLTEHISQSESYFDTAAAYKKWTGLKGGKADGYYKKHADENKFLSTIGSGSLPGWQHSATR